MALNLRPLPRSADAREIEEWRRSLRRILTEDSTILLSRIDASAITEGSVLFVDAAGDIIEDTVNLTFNTSTDILTTGHINPSSDGSNNLGSAALNWGDIYIDKTQGSVLFMGADGQITQNNSNIFWDDSNNRLGLGTNTPTYQLENTGDAFLGNRLFIDSTSSIITGVGIGLGKITPRAMLEINHFNANIFMAASGVTHGITDSFPTDVFVSMGLENPNFGGFNFVGASEGNVPSLIFQGLLGSAGPTASAIEFKGFKSDGGTGSTTLADNETVVTFHNANNKKIDMLGDGDFRLLLDDQSIIWGASQNAKIYYNTHLILDSAAVGTGSVKTTAGRIVNTTRLTSGDSPYTVLATDHIIICDTDGGAIEVDLTAGVEGKEYRISNVGSSGNDVTVDPNGAEEVFSGGAGVAFVMTDTEGITINYNTTEGWW